jgi:hypothetical protein
MEDNGKTIGSGPKTHITDSLVNGFSQLSTKVSKIFVPMRSFFHEKVRNLSERVAQFSENSPEKVSNLDTGSQVPVD